jgi:predicted nucleic acid-binding protein
MIKRFVVDNSVVMVWCFEDETSDYADKVLESLADAVAIVPAIWTLEVANTLLVAERRQRLSESKSTQFIQLLRTLPIQVIQEPFPLRNDEIITLAREQRLSSYDAAYLDLAKREAVPLATLDKSLRRAAKAIQVPLFY